MSITAINTRRRQYRPDDTVLPTSAAELLYWAADHVKNVGLFPGRNGERFASSGRTTRLRASMLGILDVAGGEGRIESGREYDWPAITDARADALDALSDWLAGGAITMPRGWTDETEYRRHVVHWWGAEPGRTDAQAAENFAIAARLAEQAEAQRRRPGRPPRRLRPVTAAGLLEWAAQHIGHVGLWKGEEEFNPRGFGDTAACSMTFAFDRAQRAARPAVGADRAEVERYDAARAAALLALVETVAEGPVDAVPAYWKSGLHAYRRTLISVWSSDTAGTTEAAVMAFRQAAARVAAAQPAEGEPVSAIADAEPEEQGSLF